MFLLRNKDAEYIHVVLVNIISIVGALNSADRFLFHDPKVPCLINDSHWDFKGGESIEGG